MVIVDLDIERQNVDLRHTESRQIDWQLANMTGLHRLNVGSRTVINFGSASTGASLVSTGCGLLWRLKGYARIVNGDQMRQSERISCN